MFISETYAIVAAKVSTRFAGLNAATTAAKSDVSPQMMNIRFVLSCTAFKIRIEARGKMVCSTMVRTATNFRTWPWEYAAVIEREPG